MTGLWIVLGTLALGVVIGAIRLRRDGRMRDVGVAGGVEGGSGVNDTPAARLTAEQLRAPLRERATLVQFSTAFCQPCRATRRVLDEVTAIVPGVQHVEIDAEARLDLVRELDIMRTPTVLVLDRAGAIVRRASGQPRKVDVIAALGDAVSHEPDSR